MNQDVFIYIPPCIHNRIKEAYIIRSYFSKMTINKLLIKIINISIQTYHNLTKHHLKILEATVLSWVFNALNLLAMHHFCNSVLVVSMSFGFLHPVELSHLSIYWCDWNYTADYDTDPITISNSPGLFVAGQQTARRQANFSMLNWASNLPIREMAFGLIMPLGKRWKSYSFPSTTTVWPALLPPCKTIKVERRERKWLISLLGLKFHVLTFLMHFTHWSHGS